MQKALHEFNNLTRLVPSNAEAQKNLSKTLLALKKYVEGFNAIKKSFMLNRYDPELYFMLLKALSQQPHEKLAYERLAYEIHHNPEYSSLKNIIQKKKIIDVHNRESKYNDKDKKFKIFNKLILKNPDMCNILFQALSDISSSFKFLLSCQINDN
jgi:predicted Zn-dependent protease